MTEEQAKTKWCAMMHQRYEVRAEQFDPDSLAVMSVPGRNCIGSACMMWREEYKFASSGNEPNGMPNLDRKIIGGYCGLAGKP